METRDYTVEVDVLWHNSHRYSNGQKIALTPQEARWFLAQNKIKPVAAKRASRRRAHAGENPDGEGEE